MKNFLFCFLTINLINLTLEENKEEETGLDSNYIKQNFESLSKKANLVNSFTKIFNAGNITLLEYFLSELKQNKIDFNSEFETFYQKKHKSFERVYNKLKYKDEISIKRIEPAFEWAENERFVILHVNGNNMRITNYQEWIKTHQMTLVY